MDSGPVELGTVDSGPVESDVLKWTASLLIAEKQSPLYGDVHTLIGRACHEEMELMECERVELRREYNVVVSEMAALLHLTDDSTASVSLQTLKLKVRVHILQLLHVLILIKQKINML